jgi:hypothetical protein
MLDNGCKTLCNSYSAATADLRDGISILASDFGRQKTWGGRSRSSDLMCIEIEIPGVMSTERNRLTLTSKESPMRLRDGCARSHDGMAGVWLGEGIVEFLGKTNRIVLDCVSSLRWCST